MKARFLLLVSLIATATVLAQPTASQLVGHWRFSDEKRTYEYTFSDDGTFSTNVAEGDKLIFAGSGKWRLDGETLHYEYTTTSTNRVPDGATDRDKLVEVTKDAFVIEARDGSRRTYARAE